MKKNMTESCDILAFKQIVAFYAAVKFSHTLALSVIWN